MVAGPILGAGTPKYIKSVCFCENRLLRDAAELILELLDIVPTLVKLQYELVKQN